ncbi:apolipoprotein N-acyltransferase [Streptomyces sp. NBC_01766]|uniref:apolipoprotein N-acyltransferase n=1 Tax=Streptomyces sp. NBC_01766 TaxID=2975936 RepID=UPI002DD7E5DC|nr:apolipoprotein N-acyltransferase [Streptomyces sp. NBC_01766]WSC23972.1 apolipoprotein N-acyltransferase [Streptomyces sp. NBC_01766]
MSAPTTLDEPAPDSGPEQFAQQPAVPSRGRRLARALVRPAVAALSGLLLYASFPPRPLWWLAPFAFAALGYTLYGRRARAGFGLGYLAGLGYLLPLLVWTGVEVGPGPWLGLAAVEALFIAAAGAGIAYVSRLPLAPLWAAGVWIAVEAARARVPFGGFPWGKVAFGQPEGVFLPLAAVGGTPLLGFAVVLCGFGIAEAVRRWATLRSVLNRRVATAAVLAVAPVAAGFAALPLVDTGAQDGTATVALIQGNVPRMGLDFATQRRAVLDHHVRATLKLAADVKAGRAAQPDLVLWPENSSDIDPYLNADAYDAIDKAAKAIKAPISVGAVVTPDNGKGAPLNQQILWDPVKGPVDTYNKRQLQPFGEYMPYRSFFRLFSSDVDLVRQDFVPGHKAADFDMRGTKVGPVTCYEAAFDWAVRDQVKAGAQIISVPSNNATFDRSEMTYQQLAMSRVRAVEHSRAVMVPVTTGVSAVIRPDGSVAQKTKMFTADALVAEVPKRSSLTPATRLGTLPEWLLVALAAGGIGWAVTRTVKTRR